MHQQNCKQQIAKRSISNGRYNTIMPIGYAMLFNELTNDDNITRLCKTNK